MSDDNMWSPAMMRRLLELNTERELYGEPSESEIAKILSDEFQLEVTKNAVHGKIWRELREMEFQPAEYVFMPKYEQYKDNILNSEISNRLLDLDLSGKKRILHISDLHIPFENKNALYTTLKARAASDIVIVSEIMDLSSQSSFAAGTKVPLEREIEETLNFLEFMSNNFPTVVIVSANHDFRVKRVLAKRLPAELAFMVQENDIMELLARPFPNVYMIPHWWVQLGDALFCHAAKSSTISMKAADELDIIINKHAKQWGINPYRLLVQAHTHSMGVIYNPDLKIFEAGCLCQLLDWVMEKPTKSVWTTGYIYVEMNNGVCDLDKCREYTFPVELQTKKELVFNV